MKVSAALYARVSTMQQEQEATIESQIAAIESYAQEHECKLSAEHYFLDQVVSGAQLDRPGLDRLRDLAAEGYFSVVLCLSPDRLARKYAHQWVLMDELKRAGVEVVFINQIAGGDNPQGQLLLGVQGLFAEYERAMITERLRRGKLYRIRQGQLVSPVAPYGYQYIPISQPNGGRWELNPVEVQVVRDIYQWYTDDEKPTISAIVDRLRALGEQAPPRGKRWGYSTVHTILRQQAYTGQAYYNRTRTCHSSIGRPKKYGRGRRRSASHEIRPKEEWITVRVPALLSEDRWQQAQERLKMNKKFAQRNNKSHFYLLRSLLVCEICGRTLAGRVSRRQTHYSCPNRGKNRSPDVEPHTCTISGRIVEPLVWEAVSKLLDNPALLADAWQQQSEPAVEDRDECQRLQARLRDLERQWPRLLDAFQTDLITKEELSQRKSRLDAAKQNLEQRLQHLQQHANQRQAKETMLQDFASFCQHIQAGLENPSPETKQEVIRLLIDHVVVGKDEIVIKHIVPTDDDCRLLPGRR
jgi:site-specific DNA recombinase